MSPLQSILRRWFISPSEKRLRSGWRLCAHLLIFFGFSVITALAWLQLTSLAGKPAGFELLEAQALTAITLTLSVIVARRLLDRRTFASLGLSIDIQALGDLLGGILISALMMLLIFVILLGANWLEGSGVSWLNSRPSAEDWSSLAMMAVLFIFVGWQEELYFRGYLLQNLRDGTNQALAVALSSIVFGLVHIGNPNWSWNGTTGIVLAGLFMAYGYLRSRRLWLPIGLHIGWNFFEGPIFGFPVSGLTTYRLIQTQISGPAIITGGEFGPEAGLVMLPALALGAGLIWLYTRRAATNKRKYQL